jgi:hypothetical protein
MCRQKIEFSASAFNELCAAGSICVMKNNTHFVVPKQDFELLKGEGYLTLYQVCSNYRALMPISLCQKVRGSPGYAFSNYYDHYESSHVACPCSLTRSRQSTISARSAVCSLSTSPEAIRMDLLLQRRVSTLGRWRRCKSKRLMDKIGRPSSRSKMRNLRICRSLGR